MIQRSSAGLVLVCAPSSKPKYLITSMDVKFCWKRLAAANGVHTRRRATQRLSDTAQIDNDSLDPVTLAFDLRLESFHLIAVEGI